MTVGRWRHDGVQDKYDKYVKLTESEDGARETGEKILRAI